MVALIAFVSYILVWNLIYNFWFGPIDDGVQRQANPTAAVVVGGD
jgi:hypothetical protein